HPSRKEDLHPGVPVRVQLPADLLDDRAHVSRRDRGVSSRTAVAPHPAACSDSVFSSQYVSQSMMRGISAGASRSKARHASSGFSKHITIACGMVPTTGMPSGAQVLETPSA